MKCWCDSVDDYKCFNCIDFEENKKKSTRLRVLEKALFRSAEKRDFEAYREIRKQAEKEGLDI